MMFLKLLFSILILPLGCCLQLSLQKIENETSTQLLFDSSRGIAFCFPPEEVMGLVADDTMHRDWGFSASWNYSTALQRVGQVFCRQLGFSYFGSITPVELEESRKKILWAASCLGYEPLISHCVYEEVIDHNLTCKNFVGLRCQLCNTSIYHLRKGETLKITSPGFPYIYNDNLICEWIIVADFVSPMVIEFRHLTLPGRDIFGRCTKGFMEIRSKKDNPSKYIEQSTLCGEAKDKIILVEDSILSLKFHSGLFHPRPNDQAGFSLTVSSLDDLTEGEIASNVGYVSLSSAKIVGIIFGIIAALIIIFSLSLLLKHLIVRERRLRRQRTMAETLQFKIHPATPCIRASAKKMPLPAIPKSTGSSISSEDKSGIYEDINNQIRSGGSYLHLDDLVKKTASEKQTDDRYNFNIPNIVFTAYSDSEARSPSYPSDAPSCLSSIASDLDSVFWDKNLSSSAEKQETNGVVSKIRNSTYTITQNNPKERRSSSPFSQQSYWNKRKQELSHFLEQRRSSEPNIKIGEAQAKFFSRLRTYKFSTSHLSA